MENKGEIIMYQPDEEVRLEVRMEDETVWLTQAQMVELFNSSKQNISRRIILAEDIRILSQKSDDDMIFNADIDELTRKCRAKLSPLSFNVFSAHKFEHLSYKEIAGIFGITVRQVNAEIQKAAKVFRDEFRDYLPLVAGLIFLVGGGSIWGNI